MVPFNPSDSPPKAELLSVLIDRYGGSPPNWRIQSTKLGYLVKSPVWLTPDQLICDAYWWEREYGLQVIPWDHLISSELLPPRR